MHRDGDGRLSKSIWAHEPILTPERKLWRAVLTQAFEDAEMTPVGEEAEGEPLEAPRARRYLRADSPFEAQDLKRGIARGPRPFVGPAELPTGANAREPCGVRQLAAAFLTVASSCSRRRFSAAAGKAGARLPHSTNCRLVEGPGASLITKQLLAFTKN